MAKVKSKNTMPELIVRKLLFKKGVRYRLHYKKLPGSPDIVFLGRKKVIFIHGCFWHRHLDCKYTTSPKTRQDFWQLKFQANIQRDIRNLEALKNLGWSCLVIWACEIKDPIMLTSKLSEFLDK